jgi:hypothetical protein
MRHPDRFPAPTGSVLALALVLVAATAAARSSNPPDANTNAPGEGSCVMCHQTFPLNSGAGELDVLGLPVEYTPGESYPLTLTLADPIAARWGFQLTVLDESGVSVGDLVATDGVGTQLSTSGDRTYLEHTLAGTQPGVTGAVSWDFTWQAPASGTGLVTVYATGNAADGNGTPLGDHVYATSFLSGEGTTVSAREVPVALQLRGNAPNPFNPRTEIRFELAVPAEVRVTVLAPDGRRVATLADGARGAGLQRVVWDGRNHVGRMVGSGTYLYVVEADGVRESGTMTLLK